MHGSSLKNMRDITNKYLKKKKQLKIYDIGSYDVNGSYKFILNQYADSYIGVDLNKGPNVDLVLDNPYEIPIKSNSADLVVSGQAFEHIEFFWLTWQEIVRITKPSGYIFIIAPSAGPEHKYPVDCWRFYPEAMSALAKYSGCNLIESYISPYNAIEDDPQWKDCVGVFEKNPKKNLFLPWLNKLKSTKK
jgi:ubiquinone/menaquinone biosynthesis C-methylase UbiE